MKSLFHSFPRVPRHGSKPTMKMGLDTLRGFFRIGFILAPEIHGLSECLQDRREGRPLKIGQKRICFTDITLPEIKKHAETFGPFSIEFDLLKLNQAGASPAFYYPLPQELDNPDDMSGIVQSLIINLGDLSNLTKELHDLKQATLSLDGNEQCDLIWGETNPATATLKAADLTAVLAYLEHKHGDAKVLNASIRGLAQFFSPTHSKANPNSLEYYQQREWRIISDISCNGKPTSRDLCEEEKSFLLSCNKDFFGKEINLLTGKYRCVDGCRVYMPPQGHPMQFAKQIVVPKECLKQAIKIVHEADIDIPVCALEET